jgi:hypothetical protein
MTKYIKESDLETGIKDGKTISLNCYTPVASFLRNLEITLKVLLKNYSKEDLLPTIFGVVQELVNFNCLNNMRYIYYENQNLDKNEIDKHRYLQIESEFLKSVSFPPEFNYRHEIVKRKMNIKTVIEHNLDGLKIQVFNESTQRLENESFLREYLKKAMQYVNIEDYYKDHPEDSQGKAIGLAFSIIILKEAGLRADLMRFGKAEEGMYSRLEIPFGSSYKSLRDRILDDESIVPFEKPNLIPPQFQEEFQKRMKSLQKDGLREVK